jgi:alkyl sulfatase BDS1-like metallo-beta-lactamase superfamily hydrolase
MSKKQVYLNKVDANELMGKDIIFVIEVLEELSQTNDDIKEILTDLNEAGENFKINFIVGNHRAFLNIENGILTTGKILIDDPVVTVKMEEEDALNLLLGKTTLMNMYKEQKLKIEGNLMKVAGLALMLNIAMDELGIM